MTRSISHSEASTLLDCQAKHAFSYTGALTGGDALHPITKHHRLREGAAWGIAMAHYHAGRTDGADAITASLRVDEEQMVIPDQHEFAQMNDKLRAILSHYTETTTPIGIDRQEMKLDVPIPNLLGDRFTGYVDGIHTTSDGDWLVEFKLRGSLSSLEQVALGRQIRWYAWAWRELTGRSVVGVIVDERKNEAPKPARILASGKVSHAKDQQTTPALYAAACEATGVAPDLETLAALGERRWQARHEVFLTTAEIDEAGVQLASMGRLVHLMDCGVLFPIRNPSQFRCPSCAFREICADPSDVELVDAFFVRKPPKKDRLEVAA